MTRDEKEIAGMLADARPRHEILTMLMSRGFREAEAAELFERISKEAPPPPSSIGVKPTDVSVMNPGVALGSTLLLAGLGLAIFTGRTSGWFFIIGAISLAGGLARMAGGKG